MSERVVPDRVARAGVPVGLPARPGVSFPRVLRAEVGKAVALPSTRWGVLAAVVVNAAVAAFVAYNARYEPGSAPPGLLGLLTLGLVATQLPVLVLGVLVSAAEYPSGAARSTFLAVPRRLPVLAAQVLAVAGVAAVTAVVVLAVTFLAVLPFRADVAMTLDTTDPATARMLGGVVLYLAAVGLLGAALGTLARAPAAGLVAGVGLVFLLERLVPLVGTPWLVAALPGWAGRLVVAPDAVAAAQAAEAGVGLTPWVGLGVMAAWVLALLLAAAVRLRRSGV
ncbi:ABC-2 type transport system permease protein [Georgenia satyanarayanai]|uniref:ABC-2 type transport system permease protein n=1 Tax=Georgenia satyanarayanai TaxID=860221 RepID=A0A2Y9BZU3_9MICO|nr:hypothetical protein [Georgenia satyanarayanai]PYF98373.1 ABC-2 type transport system permease protein [Georgenia satyanarayanai]SSA44982.1 ABC-2 type transport system permease protein [Georgenia satyanarayanai]